MHTHDDYKRMIKDFVCAVNAINEKGVSKINVIWWFTKAAEVDGRPIIDEEEIEKCLTELSDVNVHEIGFTDGKYWSPKHVCAAHK